MQNDKSNAEFVVVATIDQTGLEVVVEALEEEEIEVRHIPIRPFRQIEYLGNQHRPWVDIEVPATDEEAARAILARLEVEAEAAAMVESESPLVPIAMGKSGSKGASTWPAVTLKPPSSSTALVLGLLVPLAGPIYVGNLKALAFATLAYMPALVTILFLGGACTTFACAPFFIFFFLARLVDFGLTVRAMKPQIEKETPRSMAAPAAARQLMQPEKDSDGTRP